MTVYIDFHKFGKEGDVWPWWRFAVSKALLIINFFVYDYYCGSLPITLFIPHFFIGIFSLIRSLN